MYRNVPGFERLYDQRNKEAEDVNKKSNRVQKSKQFKSSKDIQEEIIQKKVILKFNNFVDPD